MADPTLHAPNPAALRRTITTAAATWCKRNGTTFTEDIAQQAWLLALETTTEYRPDPDRTGDTFLPWLYQRLQWRLTDWVRGVSDLTRTAATENREALEAGLEPPHHTGALSYNVGTLADRVAELADHADGYAAVEAAVTVTQILAAAPLTARERRAVVEYHLRGRFMHEIAADMGCSECYISLLVKHALTKLRRTAARASDAAA